MISTCNFANELQTVKGKIAEKQKEIMCARGWYNIFFFLTLVTPLFMLAFQICATKETFIWEPSNAVLWAAAKDTFSLSFACFAVLAAITGMLGFKHRANQLDLQQLRASKQILISQQQFDLSQRKENFVFYCEHRKMVREYCSSVLNRTLKKDESFALSLNENKFYKKAFSKNSVNNVEVLDLNARTDEGKRKSEYLHLKRLIKELDYKPLAEDITLNDDTWLALKGYLELFGFIFTTESKEGRINYGNRAQFAKNLKDALEIIQGIGWFKENDQTPLMLEFNIKMSKDPSKE